MPRVIRKESGFTKIKRFIASKIFIQLSITSFLAISVFVTMIVLGNRQDIRQRAAPSNLAVISKEISNIEKSNENLTSSIKQTPKTTPWLWYAAFAILISCSIMGAIFFYKVLQKPSPNSMV